MARNIFVVGALFVAVQVALLLYLSGGDGLSLYEQSLFYTFFVMLQFWNMFNAKTFRSGKTFFGTLSSKTSFSASFYIIAVVILLGQILIVNTLGNFFDVAPLSVGDWVRLILVTSPVLIIPDIIRALKK